MMPHSTHIQILRRLAAFVACGLAFATAVFAAEKKAFDIPAGTADRTLKQFTAQSGTEVVYAAEIARGVKTTAVRGDYLPAEALRQLLADGPLKVQQDASGGTFMISRGPNAERAAQTAPSDRPLPDVARESTADGKAVRLTPFEVSSNRDLGYTATSSLAGGRLATDLKDTPAAITVLTREFLDDIAANNFIEAANWAPNTISAYENNNNNANQFLDYETSTRSLGKSYPTRNYFYWSLNSDSYNTERLDFSRGPNSVIFGDANVGGTPNVSTKRAYRGKLTDFQYRYSDYGGPGRATLDVNRAINDQWFIRLNGLYDHTKGWEDHGKTDRAGWYLTTTYQPFKTTTIRADYEWGRLKRVVIGNTPIDALSSWDGATTVTAPLASGNFAGGLSRRTTDFLTFTHGSPNLGIVNWRNFGATVGNSRALDTVVPGFSPATFPLRPNYAWNFTPPNNYADTRYHTYSVTVEQRVGDNLFLEAAYNFQTWDQYIDNQTVWEGLQVDVNAFLPDGRANPYFRQRYAETANIQRQSQWDNDTHAFRFTAAYVLKTAFTDQRLFVSAGRRVSEGHKFLERLGRVDNPTIPDMFNVANLVRARRYESELNTDWSIPAGSSNGITTRWGKVGSPSTIGRVSIENLQAAASGSWFRSRRLTTILGIRRDMAERFSENGVFTMGPNNDVNGFGPLVRTLKMGVTTVTAGGVFHLNEAVGVFANFGQSFDLGFLARDINGVELPFPDNRGIDVGVRLNLLNNRIAGSVSYYANEQNNVRANGASTQINAIWSSLNRSESVGVNYNDTYQLKGKGVEIDFTANLTPNWRLLANVAFPQTEQVGGYVATTAYLNTNIAVWRDTANALTDTALRTSVLNNITTIQNTISGFAAGRTLNNTISYLANFFTNYGFKQGALKNFTVGGGVNFRGRRLIGNRPASGFDYIWANPYQLVTLTAGYRLKLLGKDTRFQLNVSNPFDDAFKRYFSYANYTLNGVGSYEGNRYKVQDPRRITLTTTVRF